MSFYPVAGMPLADVPTPALLLHLPVMEENIAAMAAGLQVTGTALRPHFKNHKIVALAKRQMEAGAIGITVARLRHAELLAREGISGLLITNEITTNPEFERLIELARHIDVIAAVDDLDVIARMGEISRRAAVPLSVLVDLDLGLHRTGIMPSCAVEFARAVIAAGLRFRGLMGYEGHIQKLPPGPEKDRISGATTAVLSNACAELKAAGIPVEIVSTGGTGTCFLTARNGAITEIQAGSYLLMEDLYQPFAPQFQPALSVAATVISCAVPNRVILDLGLKALSTERGLPQVKSQAGWKLLELHAEHGIVEVQEGAFQPRAGMRVEVSVHYSDATVNLHRRLYGIRTGVVEEVLPIEE